MNLFFTDLALLTYHTHSHPLGADSTLLRQIFISKFENGKRVTWHKLAGDLHPQPLIAECNSPFGHAEVKLGDGETLYACLEPAMGHVENRNRQSTDGFPVFMAQVIIGSRPKLDAYLTIDNARIPSLNQHGLLFYGREKSQALRLQPVGHVRYIKGSEINVAGELHEYPRRPSSSGQS